MLAGEEIRTVGVVGTGALGVSWVALALDRGLDVVAWDPAPDADPTLRTQLARLLGDDPVALDRLTFATGLAGVAEEADLVLEAGPERLDAKREILAALDRVSPAEVVLASSSSGLMPSTFQAACERHPERVLVAHPFNPPHLMPLVEVVGGEQTSEEAVEATMVSMRRLGKEPIRIRREVPGHVANRLQAALWREAYSLVEQGVATVADIDTAISQGPGLRWALLGPLATQHFSGGPGGMRHVLEHLGPATAQWWETMRSPTWGPELVDLLVAGVDEELAEVEQADLLDRRNRALRDLLALKRQADL